VDVLVGVQGQAVIELVLKHPHEPAGESFTDHFHQRPPHWLIQLDVQRRLAAVPGHDQTVAVVV